jgi:hypothetical protein
MIGLTRSLTLAELLEELDRIGADPASVTFQTAFGPVSCFGDDHEIHRVDGAVVVTFGSR